MQESSNDDEKKQNCQCA